MANRPLLQPIESYFVAFLAIRGINICTEDPDVIHYFGTSEKELKKLVAEHSPDLVIIHKKKMFNQDYEFPFAVDVISCDKDIYTSRTVRTNAMDLSRLYFQSLGLERMLVDISEHRKKKIKQRLQINSSAVKKFFSALMWD